MDAMNTDEQQIRDLVQRWHAASQAGETDRVLEMMTDDVVFLTVGRPPMDKAQFAAISQMPPGAARPRIEVEQDVQEISVHGDVAFMRSQLLIRIYTPQTTDPIERFGHTLTLFQKVNCRWLLKRDANLLTVRASNA